jgi:5S rRNA maturation endonuclease (ribonuclease M5)
VRIDLNQAEFPLSDTRSADRASGELQLEGGDKLRKLIEDQIPYDGVCYDKVAPTAISYDRSHRAILVEGGRGSGKTTFLLTQLHHIRDGLPECDANSKDEKADNFSKISKHVHVLPMIDPTLVEAKDNLIILIVQMIETAIDTMEGRNAAHAKKLDELDKAREALAEGLTMLDGIGQKEPYGSTWEDARWVMSEGLRKAEKGRSFERKLNIYLQRALEVMGKKAFVLTFDDVDTNFRHGHVILETIRKYLTSKQLIILLSGDLDLYGRLIRKNIYSTFGGDILQHDSRVTKAGNQDLQTAVRELEEQYLLKLLPPHNRIRMLPLGGLKGAETIQVISAHTAEASGDTALPRWISKRVRKILGERGTTDHPFVHVIWREHLRLVLSYLRALDLAIDETASTEDTHASRAAVLKVFETRLRMAEVSIELVDADSFDLALKTAFVWMSGKEEPATLVRFGTPGEPNEAIVLHCLSLAIAEGLETSGNGLKALLSLALPVVMLKRPLLADPKQKKQVFEYLWGQSKPFLPEIAARISAVDRAFQNVGKAKASSFGSVGLAGKDSGSLTRKAAIQRVYGTKLPSTLPRSYKLIEIAKADGQRRSAHEWLALMAELDRTELDAQFGAGWFTIEDLLDRERCSAFGEILNLIFFKRYSERGETFRSISAFSLLAVIAELLLRDTWVGLNTLSADTIISAFGNDVVVERNMDSAANDGFSDDDEQEAGASESPQGNTPEGGDANAADSESSEAQGSADAGADAASVPPDEYATFMSKMETWHRFARSLATASALSPSLLGTLATRIHDDLSDLDQAVTESWGSGDILHRQITNILNAVVAVTSEAQGRKESPKQSDVPLINALRKHGEALHPMAVILLSCPLIWVFLKPKPADANATTWVVDAARSALEEWRKSSPLAANMKAEEFTLWTTPPKIQVKISKIAEKGNQRRVTVNGFFDLLNVVPRYADDAK